MKVNKDGLNKSDFSSVLFESNVFYDGKIRVRDLSLKKQFISAEILSIMVSDTLSKSEQKQTLLTDTLLRQTFI